MSITDVDRQRTYNSITQPEEEWVPGDEPCGGEHMVLLLDRWQQMKKNFKKDGVFDCSKIPDIYDCSKYDLTHNAHLNFPSLPAVFRTSRRLAQLVIPGEYGVNAYHKLQIGRKVCGVLMGKLLHDLRMIQVGVRGERGVWVGVPNGSNPDGSVMAGWWGLRISVCHTLCAANIVTVSLTDGGCLVLDSGMSSSGRVCA